MYESTFVNTPSFWYGLKRPAESGRAKINPPAKAATTSKTVRPRGACFDIDSPRADESRTFGRGLGPRASDLRLRSELISSRGPKPEVRGPFTRAQPGTRAPSSHQNE